MEEKPTFSADWQLMVLLNSLQFMVGDTILLLRRIPILDVAKLLRLEFEQSIYEEYLVIRESHYQELNILIDPKTNTWRYEDPDNGSVCPYDFFECKSPIELVEKIEGISLEDAARFLWENFPEYRA
jgi:hypothetical protein